MCLNSAFACTGHGSKDRVMVIVHAVIDPASRVKSLLQLKAIKIPAGILPRVSVEGGICR
jgi:hypothetical protein